MPILSFTRRLFLRALIAAIVLIPSFSHAQQAHAAPAVVIGEVAWAGSSTSLADEWVELWNLSDTDVSLGGYSLRGGSPNPIFLPDDAVIPAHGTFLISNYPDTEVKSVLAVSPHVVTSTLSLSNSALRLSLNDAAGEIDVVGDGSAPSAGSNGTPKASMIRDGASWITATSSIGIDPDHMDLGTPGYCDGCGAETPVTNPEPTPEITPEPTPEPVIDEAPPTEDVIIASSTDPVIDTILATSTASETPIEPVVTEPTEPVQPPLEQTLPVKETTSTEPAPESDADVAASSVVLIEEPLPETTVTEPVPSTPVETQTTPAASEPTTTPNPVPTVATPSYELLRLNEFMPQPEGEAEWIEITSIDPTVSVSLENVTLHDAAGKIATIANGTIDTVTPSVRINLSSAKLNNSGDTVTLRDPSGRILDGITYTFSEKARSWIRTPDALGDWHVTLLPTPNAANVLQEEEEPETPSVATSTPVMEPATPAVPTVSPAIPPVISLPDAPILTTPAKPETSKPKDTASEKKTTTKTTSSKTKSVASTSATAAKKSTTTKKTASKLQPQSITHAMATDESYAGIPVSLRGIVGTPPGLVPGHYFILLSSDGRGLKVHVPTSRKLPSMGQEIRVVGILNFNDKGIPTLGMRKDDPLEVIASTNVLTPQPRIVDLMTPAMEDAWSLLQVTGTVLSVKGTNVSLDLADAEVMVSIKSLTGYRVARIQPGDTLRVRGVLELNDMTPRLLVRSADDVEITGHATPVAAATNETALPGWMPFGAAGVAIAGTEGVKQLRTRWKQRSLEKILQTGLNTTESAT
jgi:hypothetical protein